MASHSCLTTDEINELARVFHAPRAATHVLAEAGLARERQPYWQGTNALEFWREVNVMVSAGAIADGRQAVLTAARRHYPANAVFRRAGEPREPSSSETPVEPLGSTATAGRASVPDIRRFVIDRLPQIQRWMDMDGLLEVVARLLSPDETPLDLANGVFGRTVPGSGIMLVTDRHLTIAERDQNSGLGQVLRIRWDTLTDVRLSHRRRVVVAVSDVELITEDNRLRFRGVLREPAIRIADQIRDRIS